MAVVDNLAVVQDVLLKRVKQIFQTRINQDMLEDMGAADDWRFEAFTDHVARQLIITARRHIAAQKLEYVDHSYPADWWEALKDRFMPKSWLKRWPLKMTVVRLEPTVVYTQIALPEEKHYVTVSKIVWQDTTTE